MKKLLATVLAIAALMAMTLSATATPTGIGIYDAENPGNANRCHTAAGFQIFPMYIIGFNLGPFTGWEAGVSFSDPTWQVLSTTLHPAAAINVGSAPTNFIVGLSLIANGTPRYTLATYSMGYFLGPTAPELQMCLGPSTPSSFNPPAPGYSTADDVLLPLTMLETATTNYAEGCAIVNPVFPDECVFGLSASELSFGEVKARF